MRFFNLNLAMAAAALISTSSAYSFINATAFYGMPSVETTVSGTTTKYSGSEMGVSLHLDPIPLVPVSFGVGVTMPTVEKDSTKVTGLLVDLQVTGWSPISLAGFTPYATLGYIAKGAYGFEGTLTVNNVEEDVTYAYLATGNSIGIGTRYSLIPLVEFMLEYKMRTEKLSIDDIEGSDAVPASSLPDLESKTSSIQIGIRAGI
jgi:hypothetical protein